MNLPDKNYILIYVYELKRVETISEEQCDQIAMVLLDQPEILSGIEGLPPKDVEGNVLAYREADSERDGREAFEASEEATSEDKELAIAVDLFNKYGVGKEEHPLYGHVMDYQTPVGEEKSRIIDLITYLHAKDTMFIIKIVAPDRKEALIGCVLDCYTGLKLLNKEAFVANMENIYPEEHRITMRTKFKAAPMIFRNKECRAYRDYFECFNNVHVLMDELNVEPIFL